MEGFFMTTEQLNLAARIKAARINAGLTQDDVGRELELNRTAIVQLESGKRTVSTLELAGLASLFGIPIASFFETNPATNNDDALVMLFRAALVEGHDLPWQQDVSRVIEICRAGVELEQLLNQPPHMGPPSYDYSTPQSVLEAIDQGNRVAEQERMRLSLGNNPIPDMSDLINGQNIWASGVNLPDDMSGLFLQHRTIGLFVLVNYAHPRARKRFSYAHEYAHALLDRHQSATVSRIADRKKLTEVRANAFAASFLLPRGGVWAFLSSRHKAGPSFSEQTVYDPEAEQDGDGTRASRRSAPRSQSLTYEDVAMLANHFGVSYQAAIFRLKSLAIINEAEFCELRDKESFGNDYIRMLKDFGDSDNPQPRCPDREIVSQVLHLAIEAFRREEISSGKLRDLSSLLGVPAKKLIALAEAA
jgi:Zn-dependent peptidase ImmA (M78 family)/transcriptional regulator with XRE-family HTH domain